jgi:hypothetical protein
MGTNEAKQITIKLGVGLVAAVLLVPINYESKAEPLLTPAILDRVDPKHQLGDGERTIAGLCALMQFHISRGEPEKAKRAASALLYAFQIHKRRYEMIADAALKRGEISTATRAAAMAYAKMPTGRDLRFELIADGQISATGTDDTTGKIVNRRILSPQRLGAQLIGGLPENFEKLIADIAEEEVPESQPPIPAKPPRVSRTDHCAKSNRRSRCFEGYAFRNSILATEDNPVSARG